jgi:transcriptional regulator with XRE-family HTH domain
MFGERLSILRINKKLTHQDMADRLGITRQAYGNYENDNREPGFETMQKLADFFEVSVDYLLGRTENSDGKTDDGDIGRAFYGGADQYSEEELEIARAAAKAAVEGYRKGLNKNK